MRIVRPIVMVLALLGVWQALISIVAPPPYILPSPYAVLQALVSARGLILAESATTLLEIVLGLALGAIAGIVAALILGLSPPSRRWLLPLLVASQAIPVFALAPLLVLWLGYGLASKIAMAALIIFFPVTAAFYDGLRRTDPGWLDLARSMSASPLAILAHIRLPAALPALASGLRVAVAVAPIGAVIGEWVGSGQGLGFLMLQANARMQIDLMFAALFALAFIAVGLYALVDSLLRRAIPWQPESLLPMD